MDSRVVRCNHLIKKIQKGNEKALEDLFREFGYLFLNMAKKYLYDKTYAEDLVSDVFLDIIRTSAKSFDESKNGLNWIFTIIRNKAYRRNHEYGYDGFMRSNIESLFLGDYMPDIYDGYEKSVDSVLLKQGMEKLSAEENEILYYKYWEYLTVREIAARMNKPRSTIQHQIKIILKKLRKHCDFES